MSVRAAGVVLVALVACAALAADAPPSQQDVEEALTCQCGCGLTVHSCNHLQCGSAEPIKKEIAERLARGEDKETIVAAFRTRFGEKVLSAPTFRGFNWLAWLTPFAVIRRWVRAPRAPATAATSAVTDDPLRRRLARELADLDREG
jgi:cytochrome c-type biogenesis protein CcmH/NrfF